MRKLYWIIILFGGAIVFIITGIVGSCNNEKISVIYVFGIIVGIIIKSLFQEILFLKQKYFKE